MSNRLRVFCEVSLQCVNLRQKNKFYFSSIWLHAFETDYIDAGEKGFVLNTEYIFSEGQIE